MIWVIAGTALTGVIACAVVALRRAFASATVADQPTPNEAKADARALAQETLHASDSDVARRVDELRARGRSGK